MAIDPREIAAVAHVLQLDHAHKPVDKVAEECIKALHAIDATAVRQSMGPLVVGECFRTPRFTNPMIVAWSNGKYVWLVNKADTYGLITLAENKVWHWREPARITAAVREKAITNKDGHIKGDMFIVGQSPHEVVSVCMNGILLLDDGIPFAVSNDEINRFHKKVG